MLNSTIRVCSFIFVLFFLSACATPQVQKTRPVTLLIKSPLLKINDAGFIHETNNLTDIQIYSSGKNVLDLKIARRICINGVCEDKIAFNEKFFAHAYYDDLLLDISRSQAIFGGVNSHKSECGFIQNISNLGVKYEVCERKTSFRSDKVKIEFTELE